MQTSKVRWQQDSEGTWLCFQVSKAEALETCGAMDPEKTYDLTIKQHREKRSNDANAYCWVLMDRLADVLNTTKEDIYREMVRRVGPYKVFHLTEDEAKTFRVGWEKIGKGWPTEQVDYTPDGDRVVIRAYYGSSTYNTKQMSRLIDMVVSECKEQGIETLTPLELERMKEAWGHAQRD